MTQKYLTPEGYAAIQEELRRLEGPERDALALRLREAIQMGDLSENADYHKAKEDQGFLEGRIQELKYLISNAVIIDRTTVDLETVQVGNTVTVQEVGEDYDEKFYIVGAKEADPRAGKISNESPIGRALMGRRQGDVVDASTPSGTIRLIILKVE